MLGRIQFSSNKFRVVRPKAKGVSRKPRYDKMYKWLADALSGAGVRHKVIDLDRDKSGKKQKTQYGNTILVMMNTRYQIVCGWFPVTPHAHNREATSANEGYYAGFWGIEIFKERGAWDRWLWRNRLNERDPLVRVIMGFLATEEFSDISFVKEKELKRLYSHSE